MDEINKENKENKEIKENENIKVTEPEQNKTHFKDKYWGFLVLELLVVFLGVTAGFLLNNWQVKSNEMEMEQKYISGFLQDVNENIKEVKESIEEDSLWIERTMPLLLLTKDGIINVDSAKIVMKLIANVSRMNLISGTYEDIKNSGNLNLITNFNLKSEIVNYYLEVSGVRFIEDYFYTYFRDFIMPYIFSNYNVLKENFQNPDIVNSAMFSNIFTGYYSMVQQSETAKKKLLEKGVLLREELKKFAVE